MEKDKLWSWKRFKELVNKLTSKWSEDSKALAAYIGRKKYGKERFQELAVAWRKRAMKKRIWMTEWK